MTLLEMTVYGSLWVVIVLALLGVICELYIMLWETLKDRGEYDE